MRDLTALDLKTLVKMLGKLNQSSIDSISVLMSDGGTDYLAVGIALFKIVASDLTDDIYAWLASLKGITAEELDKQGFTAPIDIVKELIQKPEFESFFTSAAGIAGSKKK